MNFEIHVSEQFICKLGSSDFHIAAENVQLLITFHQNWTRQ